jgi:hypothetical protein
LGEIISKILGQKGIKIKKIGWLLFVQLCPHHIARTSKFQSLGRIEFKQLYATVGSSIGKCMKYHERSFYGL